MVLLTPLGHERKTCIWGGYCLPRALEWDIRLKAKGLGPPMQWNNPPEMQCPKWKWKQSEQSFQGIYYVELTVTQSEVCWSPNTARLWFGMHYIDTTRKWLKSSTWNTILVKCCVVTSEPCSYFQFHWQWIINNLVFEWKVHFNGWAMLSEGPLRVTVYFLLCFSFWSRTLEVKKQYSNTSWPTFLAHHRLVCINKSRI